MTDLEIEASITVYTFKGGVEQRRPWKPMARLYLSMLGMTDKLNEIGVAMNDLTRSLKAQRLR